MYQVVEMSHEEKTKMYKKCSKGELISMLLENQRLLAWSLQKSNVQEWYPSEYVTDFVINFTKCQFYMSGTGTSMNCIHCGKPRHEH